MGKPKNGGSLSVDGWSKEQEAQLHRAHLHVRATPNFWRDIAKMVPGKTADECFHKFYSAHPTPQQHHQTRTSSLFTSSPVRSMRQFTPTKLLHDVKKTKTTGGKLTGKSKSAIIKSHKAVREILRNQQTADQGFEEDAFTALESTTDVPSWDTAAAPSPDAPPAPRARKRKQKASRPAPSTTSSTPPPFQSPEVLKHLTDEKKHERFLDVLLVRNRLRTTRKKAARAKPNEGSTIKSSSGFSEMLKTRLESSRSISRAKTAVIASAMDVLEQATTSAKPDSEDGLSSDDNEWRDSDSDG